jgi:glutaredoxin-like protein
MLRDADKSEVRERLNGMKEPVSVFFFTQQLVGMCRTCFETEQLLKEVTPLSDRLSLEIRNFVTDVEDVRRFGIDKIPAICPVGEKDHGIRLYGIPSGYEFMTLLETFLRLSTRESGVSEATLTALKTLTKPAHLQVFVTPTCPYCPRAAVTAVQLSMASDLITCEIVEISEFPHLAQKYEVKGVPKVVINEAGGFEGALPENLFVDQILQSFQSPQS